MTDPRYPIGKFSAREKYSINEIQSFIDKIAALPEQIENALAGLNTSQLDTPYRDGGWTVRQVIHHVADSHSNAYIRFKWALTEQTPLIKAYNEKAWAQTPEVTSPPSLSINLLHALHQKWIVLLKCMSFEEFQREIIHPETGKHISLAQMAGTYAWHGEHHTAHITSLRQRQNW